MMDMASSDAGILAQLKALNRTWCMDGGTNRKEGPTTPDTDVSIETAPTMGKNAQQHQLDRPEQKTAAPLTPLEKARAAISKLPPATSSAETTNNSIVPYLFSVLNEKDNDAEDSKDKENLSSSSSSSSPTAPVKSTDKNATSEYELRQIEWHVVLILELWSCASQSTSKEGFLSKSEMLDALTSCIRIYRDNQSRQKNIKTDNNKKRKKRKKDKKDSKASAMRILSENEKETLLLDHLVLVLSRAPFLLPRDIPLSQFFNDRIFRRERLFWERLDRVVSHIFETFEITKPKDGKDDDDSSIIDRSLLLSSGVDKKNDNSTERSSSGGKKKYEEDAKAAKKRKQSREKLQAIAKNKKRQRLASLTSKKKHRGSHFHRNLDDISKLLEKKKKKDTLTASTRGKMMNANSGNGAMATLKERKASSNNIKTMGRNHRSEKVDPSVEKTMGRQKKTKGRVEIIDSNRGNTETKVKRGEVGKYPTEKILDRKRNNKLNSSDNSGNNRDTERNRSSDIEVLPVTPRKTFRSNTTLIVGETPVPSGSGKRFDTVVGETPVAGNGSRVLETIVGETPTYESNTFGATPMSSRSEIPFFSPPALPSPTKLPIDSFADETTIPPKQPLKLFGLLKRTNSVSSRGKTTTSWDGNVYGRYGENGRYKAPSEKKRESGSKRKADGKSSIDTARAFLRSKSL